MLLAGKRERKDPEPSRCKDPFRNATPRDPRLLTVIFDDGDVDKTLRNLGNTQGHIHRLQLQLFLVVVFLFDEERDVDI